MKVCICNNFNDAAVKEYLEEHKNEKIKLKDLYKACSDGKNPQCGTCVREMLKDIVEEHNSKISESAPSRPS